MYYNYNDVRLFMQHGRKFVLGALLIAASVTHVENEKVLRGDANTARWL